MSQHALRVVEVVRLSDDAVAVGLEVPDDLRATFAHQAGQHLPVRVPPALLEPGAPEERRTYSICTPPSGLGQDGPATVRIGVRRHPHGVLSRHLVDDLRAGDVLEVGPPAGRFTWPPATPATAADAAPHLVCVAAGSGITPLLAIATEALVTDPRAQVTLVRVDRTAGSVMFADDVADLKDAHPHRCAVVHVLTREHQSSALLSGRWDDDRVKRLLDGVLAGAPPATGWYLCGPHPLVEGLRTVLEERGVDPALVHRELFAGAGPAAPVRETGPARGPAVDPGVDLEVVLGGRRTAVPVGAGDDNLLDALLRVRRDAPYACRGGVCGTCRARVVEGAVAMADQWALEPEEVAAGYALACRSRATTPRVLLDLDA